MSAQDRGATQDYSRGLRGRRAGSLLLLSAVFGAILLIAADLSTLYEVHVLTVTKASVSGHAQHGWALALVGLAALPVAAAATRNRRALLGLAVLGAAALAVAAVSGDFHDVQSTGAIGRLYEGATAQPRRGFYLETLGAVLLVVGGFGALLAGRGGVDGRPPRVRPAVGAQVAAEAVPRGPSRAAGPPPPPPPRPRAARPRRRPPPAPAPPPAPDPDDWFA